MSGMIFTSAGGVFTPSGGVFGSSGAVCWFVNLKTCDGTATTYWTKQSNFGGYSYVMRSADSTCYTAGMCSPCIPSGGSDAGTVTAQEDSCCTPVCCPDPPSTWTCSLSGITTYPLGCTTVGGSSVFMTSGSPNGTVCLTGGVYSTADIGCTTWPCYLFYGASACAGIPADTGNGIWIVLGCSDPGLWTITVNSYDSLYQFFSGTLTSSSCDSLSFTNVYTSFGSNIGYGGTATLTAGGC